MFYTSVAQRRNDILLRGYEDGQPVCRKIHYHPYLFTNDDGKSNYKTLSGTPVSRKDFDSISDARKFFNDYKDTAGKKVYGLNNYTYTFINDTYTGEIEYDPALVSVMGLDIELDISGNMGFPDVRAATNEVTLITISRNGKKEVFGCGDYKVHAEDIIYHKCDNEVHLLKSFLIAWNSSRFFPDIITGWNIEFFDIPYLVNRIRNVLGESYMRKLSPWGFVDEREVERFGKAEQAFDLVGIATLDYLQLYRKFSPKQQESYRLDHIAFQELGERKLDYGEYGSLSGLQTGNWQLYTEYNIKDVDLVDKLDEKLKFIELVMAFAYDAKVNYQDTFTTVRPWDIVIHNYLLDRNIVIHPFSKPDSDRGIMGGYVKDPQVGMHKWVVSLDYTSLYPLIIMQYNISPDVYAGRLQGSNWGNIDSLLDGSVTQEIRDKLIRDNVSVTANGLTFSRGTPGFLAVIMEKMYNDRVLYKKKMISLKQEYEALEDKRSAAALQLVKDIARYDALQQAKKLQLNSGYGALANVWNRWYQSDFAEAITSSGQLATRWVENNLNVYLNKLLGTTGCDYVIACDTDSVYIKLDSLVEKRFGSEQQDTQKIVAFLDKICKRELEPFIDRCCNELAVYMNAREQKMKMKREAIADKGIWTAKKRYILNVYNNEGVSYDKPKLKMMGIEAIRTSTPQACRDAIEEALTIIMSGSEKATQQYVTQFKERFNTLPFEEVAFPRSVKDLEKYADSSQVYKKATPIGVKGALIYNNILKQRGLETKYESITSGQKIKFSYMRTPNPLKCSVVSCPGSLPSELNLDKYIDRNMQFEKAFLEPIKNILEAIGWKAEKKANLFGSF